MPQDFYTFVRDLRPFGNGTPVTFKYDPAFVTSGFANATQGELTSGEFVAYDATNRRVVRHSGNAGNGQLLGISRDSALGIKKLGNQSALALTELSVFTSGIHEMLGSTGDVYVHGDAVFMGGTNAQTVQKSNAAGVVQVGIVHLPDGSSRSGVTRVPVLIDAFTKTNA